MFMMTPPQRQPSSFSDERMSSTLSSDDEAVALRIQQEFQDAEYAQRLSMQEQQQQQQAQLQLQQQQQEQQSKRCTVRKIIPLLVCGSLVAIVPLLFVFGVFDSSDVPFFGDLFDNDWNGDPWQGNTTNGGPTAGSNALAWESDGVNGVTIQILNACSDDWQPILAEAIANWENGSPIDSLTLQTRRVDYESRCSDVTGALKVCNGDYGNTQWRGLNEVMINPRRNTIISSTAKLNEYYLAREGDAQRLYTACHEIGHGFGLPHWDEDFFNQDLGNCMDYTQNPSLNSKPDESNFLYLASLYGGRNVTTAAAAATATDASSAVAHATVPTTGGGDGGRRRASSLRQIQQHRSRLLDVLPYHPERRILHANDHHEVHMIPCDDAVGGGGGDDVCMKLQQYLLPLST
jgi:hypothetical protein